MTWRNQLKGDSLSWVLESDSPGVRYLAMRDLLDYAPDDPDFQAARKAAHIEGPLPRILDEMEDSGFWARPGPGYNPKYRSSVWSVILLAQLGGSLQEDERIERACAYLLEQALTDHAALVAPKQPSQVAQAVTECLLDL